MFSCARYKPEAIRARWGAAVAPLPFTGKLLYAAWTTTTALPAMPLHAPDGRYIRADADGEGQPFTDVDWASRRRVADVNVEAASSGVQTRLRLHDRRQPPPRYELYRTILYRTIPLSQHGQILAPRPHFQLLHLHKIMYNPQFACLKFSIMIHH